MRTRAPLSVLAIVVFAGCGTTGTTDEPQSKASEVPATFPQEPVPADCVNPPADMSDLIEQTEPAACYGSADLTVDAHATLFQGVMDCPGGLEPDWLGCGGQQVELFALETGTRPAFVLASRVLVRGPSLFATVHPDSGIDLHRGLDAPVTVTGHFDDPASVDCRYTAWPDAEAPPASDEVIEGCRSRFVITGLAHLDVSELPDPEPSEAPQADAEFSPHDIAQVVTTDLVVRSAPGVGSDSEIYDWQLDAPTLLYVFDGPVEADGYDWYQVMPSILEYLPTPYGVGWVAAAGKDGEPWIGPATPACPAPTLESVASLSGLGALACFGGSDLSLEGDLGGCVARDEGQSPAEPWPTSCSLMRFDCCPNVVPYPSGIIVWNEAVLSQPFERQPARVSGHYDNGGAGCADAAREGAGPVPAGWGTFVCRTSFLVAEVTALD